jgi:hypothetical protein
MLTCFDIDKDKALAHGDPLDSDDDVTTAFEPFDRSHPWRRWISFPGCDFFFQESNITNFHIALRFKKLKGDASTVAKADKNGGLKTRTAVAPIAAISPQAEFRYNGSVDNVKSVDGSNAKCKLTFDDSDDSDCEELELPVDQVIVLVKEYNTPLSAV